MGLPQNAIHTDKEAAVRRYGKPLDEGLRIEVGCFNRLLGGDEIHDGHRRLLKRDHPDREQVGGSVTPGLQRY
jgi:enoyl-CoA hydratase